MVIIFRSLDKSIGKLRFSLVWEDLDWSIKIFGCCGGLRMHNGKLQYTVDFQVAYPNLLCSENIPLLI